MGNRYYFPNAVANYEGAVIEIASGGTVYQRDERGSLRRIPSVWLGRQQRFEVELLDGRKVSMKVAEGKLVVTAAEAAAKPPAEPTP